MTYFNTTDQTGLELKTSTRKAESQTERILEFFKLHSGELFPPHIVHFMVGGDSPITSTRRAISDLTKEGKLEKTMHKEMGDYDSKTYCWTLKKQEGQTSLFD